MHCPHCLNETKEPNTAWRAAPWHCSSCGGLFGVGARGIFRVPYEIEPLSPLLSEEVARRWCFYAGPSNSYVYALCYPSALAFYVGSGNNNRALRHVPEAIRTPKHQRTEKHEEILALLESGDGVSYHFLGLFATRYEATVLENWYIDHYGIRSDGGLLTNLAGGKEIDTNIDLNHIGHPEEPPTIAHPNANGKWKQSIRVFHHSDLVVPPPIGAAIVSGAVSQCVACGELGQHTAEMRYKKLLCGNCGHYFAPIDRTYDDGSDRVYFTHPISWSPHKSEIGAIDCRLASPGKSG